MLLLVKSCFAFRLPTNSAFGQARTFDATYGGGESNVAVSLANYGLETEFVTRLPKNDMGEACLQYLRQYQCGDAIISCAEETAWGSISWKMGQSCVAARSFMIVHDSSFATISTGNV